MTSSNLQAKENWGVSLNTPMSSSAIWDSDMFDLVRNRIDEGGCRPRCGLKSLAFLDSGLFPPSSDTFSSFNVTPVGSTWAWSYILVDFPPLPQMKTLRVSVGKLLGGY